MGRAEDADGDLAAVGDQQLADLGHHPYPPHRKARNSSALAQPSYRRGSPGRETASALTPSRRHSPESAQSSATTGFSSAADPVDGGRDDVAGLEGRCRSPSRRPTGVPVEMTSPGSSVTHARQERDDRGDGEDHLRGRRVLLDLAVDRQSRSASACGSSTASAERMHGPIGQNVSCHLPCSQSKNLSRSRGLRPGFG